MTPTHKHDCDDCKYLGSTAEGTDLYYCPKPIPWPTLIGRYGVNEKYFSVPQHLINNLEETNPSVSIIKAAYLLAKSKGYCQ